MVKKLPDDFRKKYNLTYVWIFGSYAKKKQNKNSDIDILVKTEDVAEGFKLVEVKFALEEVLEKKCRYSYNRKY